MNKRRLDLALGVQGELLQVDNDPGGFTVLELPGFDGRFEAWLLAHRFGLIQGLMVALL